MSAWATAGVLLGAAVHFGVAWMLPLDPAIFFALMVGGIFVGSLLSLYFLLLAFRFHRSWRARIGWLVAFMCVPLAPVAAWYMFVWREPLEQAPRQ
jgi:hypothetical protein